MARWTDGIELPENVMEGLTNLKEVENFLRDRTDLSYLCRTSVYDHIGKKILIWGTAVSSASSMQDIMFYFNRYSEGYEEGTINISYTDYPMKNKSNLTSTQAIKLIKKFYRIK